MAASTAALLPTLVALMQQLVDGSAQQHQPQAKSRHRGKARHRDRRGGGKALWHGGDGGSDGSWEAASTESDATARLEQLRLLLQRR